MLGDGEIHGISSAVDYLGRYFSLTEGEKSELLPSGKQARFANRIGWARTELKQAGLVEYPGWGSWRISERGRTVLNQRPERIDRAFLMRFEEYQHFYGQQPNNSQMSGSSQSVDAVSETTPQETLASAHQTIQKSLANEVLETVKKRSPQFFERLVVDLLVKMGYGGSQEEAGRAIGGSGDGGIDGIINEDRLGLDTIYIQAKRWEGSVGRSEIQKFAGALQGQKARKGVFIATSDFSKRAREFADNIETKIILIDGIELAKFMIEYDIGVETEATYLLKRINPGYFEE